MSTTPVMFWGRFQKDVTLHHNVEPYDRRQKSSLGFFCHWCFVTIPSYLVKDPGHKEYKNIHIQFDCFFSMCNKTQFILITGIKSREKPALSQEIKTPGNEADVHVFNFSIAKTFRQFHVAHSFNFNCFNTFIWMSPVHSTFSFYDANARAHLFNISNVWGFETVPYI